MEFRIANGTSSIPEIKAIVDFFQRMTAWPGLIIVANGKRAALYRLDRDHEGSDLTHAIESKQQAFADWFLLEDPKINSLL